MAEVAGDRACNLVMKPTIKQLLSIYRKNLARYEREGSPNVEVQRRLVAKLERDAELVDQREG